MRTLRKQVAAIFADRSSQQSVVQDPEGNFWTIPSVEDAWNQRQPFHPSEQTDLSPVPGHYRKTLGLPF